jgi:hypothetical protein
MSSSLISFLNSISITGSTDTDLYTFISAGQSNIDGRCDIVDAPEWLNQSNPEISKLKVWNSTQYDNFKLGLNTGSDFNAQTDWAFDMVFYHLYSEYKDRNLYLIKRSKGGTPIYIQPAGNEKGCWNVDFDNIPVGTPKLLQELEYKYNSGKTYIENLGKSLTIKAILWYQGGTDVEIGGDAITDYKENFRNVINYIRNTIVGVPTVPFIFVTQSHNSLTYNTVLESGQTELVSEMTNLYMVDAKDVVMQPDNIHINADGAEWVGTDAYNQLKLII